MKSLMLALLKKHEKITIIKYIIIINLYFKTYEITIKPVFRCLKFKNFFATENDYILEKLVDENNIKKNIKSKKIIFYTKYHIEYTLPNIKKDRIDKINDIFSHLLLA